MLMQNMNKALDIGVDDFITAECSGVKLACHLYSRICKQRRISVVVNNAVQSQRDLAQHALDVENGLHDAVWSYFRYRVQSTIPRIDESFGFMEPEYIDGARVGAKLGEGSFGIVCKLVRPAPERSEAVKIVEKKPLTSLQGLKSIDQQIRVMRLLSSDAASHPNIGKLYA